MTIKVVSISCCKRKFTCKTLKVVFPSPARKIFIFSIYPYFFDPHIFVPIQLVEFLCNCSLELILKRFKIKTWFNIYDYISGFSTRNNNRYLSYGLRTFISDEITGISVEP